MSNVAAMFLINLPAEQAFIAMRNMLERHCMRSFVGGAGAKDDVCEIISFLVVLSLASC